MIWKVEGRWACHPSTPSWESESDGAIPHSTSCSLPSPVQPPGQCEALNWHLWHVSVPPLLTLEEECDYPKSAGRVRPSLEPVSWGALRTLCFESRSALWYWNPLSPFPHYYRKGVWKIQVMSLQDKSSGCSATIKALEIQQFPWTIFLPHTLLKI